MELNNYFETIRDFYKSKSFCDLKIIAVPNNWDNDEKTEGYKSVICHSLVLFSAIPELRFCIQSIQENEEDIITIFIDNSDFGEVESVISGIYNALVSSSDSEQSISENISSYHQGWKKTFGLDYNKEKSSATQQICVGTETQRICNETTHLAQIVKKEVDCNKLQPLQCPTLSNQDCQDKESSSEHVPSKCTTSLSEHNIAEVKDNISFFRSDNNSPSSNTNGFEPILSQTNSTNLTTSTLNQDIKDFAQFTNNMPTPISNHIVNKVTGDTPDTSDKKDNLIISKIVKKEYKERTCLDCDKKFPFNTKGQKSAYQEHISSHFKCDCNITFGDRKAFKLHIKTIHKGKHGKGGQKDSVDGTNKTKSKKDKPLFR